MPGQNLRFRKIASPPAAPELDEDACERDDSMQDPDFAVEELQLLWKSHNSTFIQIQFASYF